MEWKWERAGKLLKVPIGEYLEEIIKGERALGREVKVSIGTDSQRDGRDYKFATVIAIISREHLGKGVYVGRGGKMIYADYKLNMFTKNKEGVNERMIAEVGKSIEVAIELTPLLNNYGIKLEIHADINPDPQWESNKALSNAVGYILGMGYDFKVKPNAFTASYCGDKYANGKKG
jgi:predicted RNase H-related nuclease YkuK (DUF458 family)